MARRCIVLAIGHVEMVEEVEEVEEAVMVMVQGRKKESWNVQHTNKIMWCQSFNELRESVELTAASPASLSPPNPHFHHLLDMSTTCHHIDTSNCHQNDDNNRGSRHGCIWSPRCVFLVLFFLLTNYYLQKLHVWNGNRNHDNTRDEEQQQQQELGLKTQMRPKPQPEVCFFFPLFFY